MPKAEIKLQEGCSACRQRRVRCDKKLPKCRNCLETNNECAAWSKPDIESDNTTGQLGERTVSALVEAVPPVSKHLADMPAELPKSREYPQPMIFSSTSTCNEIRMVKIALSIDTTSPIVGKRSRAVEGSISPLNLASRQASETPRLESCSPPIHPQLSVQALLEEANMRLIRAQERDLETHWIPFNPEYDLETEEATSVTGSDIDSIELEDLLDSSGDEEEISSAIIPGASERPVPVSEPPLRVLFLPNNQIHSPVDKTAFSNS